MAQSISLLPLPRLMLFCLSTFLLLIVGSAIDFSVTFRVSSRLVCKKSMGSESQYEVLLLQLLWLWLWLLLFSLSTFLEVFLVVNLRKALGEEVGVHFVLRNFDSGDELGPCD